MDLDALVEQGDSEQQPSPEVVNSADTSAQTTTTTETAVVQPADSSPKKTAVTTEKVTETTVTPNENTAPEITEEGEPFIAPEAPVRHISHSYDDDLSKALDTTDAAVVQTLLNDARDREEEARQRQKAIVERRWYVTVASILIITAVLFAGFSFFHFQSLTVPAIEQISIGVFPTTNAIPVNTTDIRQLLATAAARTDTPNGKAFLFSLTSDNQTNTPLSDDQTIAFTELKISEPLRMVLQNIHLGGYNNGTTVTPFIIAGVKDPEIASKELLVNEPSLLQQFYTALGITLKNYTTEIGDQFTGTYISNLSVRSLVKKNNTTEKTETVLLYGYTTDRILVITTTPEALKAVYETVIKQY